MTEPYDKAAHDDRYVEGGDAPEWPPAPAIMPPTPPGRRTLRTLTTSARADVVVGVLLTVLLVGTFGMGAALLSPFVATVACFYYPYVGRGMLVAILIPTAAFALHSWVH